MIRAGMALALAAALSFGVSACTGDEGSSTTTPSTTSTSSPSEGLSVSTPDGEVTLNLDGGLPDDWPEDFPLPANTEPAGSGSLEGADSGVMIGVFRTEEPGRDAFSVYTSDESLQPSGQRSAGAGSGFVGSVRISGTYEGSVTVVGLSGTTYVVVILRTEPGGSTDGGTTIAPGAPSTTTAPGSS
jgi:hypothetical protein